MFFLSPLGGLCPLPGLVRVVCSLFSLRGTYSPFPSLIPHNPSRLAPAISHALASSISWLLLFSLVAIVARCSSTPHLIPRLIYIYTFFPPQTDGLPGWLPGRSQLPAHSVSRLSLALIDSTCLLALYIILRTRSFLLFFIYPVRSLCIHSQGHSHFTEYQFL
jgi:hypothetical protein